MRRKWKMIGICCVLVCACLLAGCAKPENSYQVALVLKSHKTEFWNLVYRGASAFAAEHNIELELYGPEEEKEKDVQLQMFQECVKEKDAVVLAPADQELFEEPVKAAEVPVVLIDCKVQGDAYQSIVATDNYGAGRVLAREFLEQAPERGKLALISSVKGTSSAVDRENGFLDEIRKNSEIEILETQYCESQTEKSCTIVREILEKDPEVNMIAGMNAQSLLGAAQAAAAEVRDGREIYVGGIDCLAEVVEYIEEGVVEVCILQNPYMMGYYGLENAWKLLQGERVEKDVWTDTKIINKENVFEKENQELIFPIGNPEERK